MIILFTDTVVVVVDQLVSESERLRMKKLEELSKNVDSMQ